MGAFRVSQTWVTPCSCKKDAGEHIRNGAGENSNAFSVCRPRVLAAWAPGVEQVLQTRVSRLLHTKRRTGEGRQNNYIRGLLDGRCYL